MHVESPSTARALGSRCHDAISAMLILTPLWVPVAMALGIDPIPLGLVMVLTLMLGSITPPVGIALFVTARVADLPFGAVCKATLPFLIPLVAVLLAIILWPPLTTWLPSPMK